MLKKKRIGFTLIELIMVMVIIGILAGVSVHPLSRFFELWLSNNSRMEILWGSRGLMRDLVFNVRMIKDKQSLSIATPTRLRFVNSKTNNFTEYQLANGIFYKNGAQIMARASCPGNKCFTYYFCNKLSVTCSEVVSPVVAPGVTNINKIKIDILATHSGEAVQLRTEVVCRNLE